MVRNVGHSPKWMRVGLILFTMVFVRAVNRRMVLVHSECWHAWHCWPFNHSSYQQSKHSISVPLCLDALHTWMTPMPGEF